MLLASLGAILGCSCSCLAFAIFVVAAAMDLTPTGSSGGRSYRPDGEDEEERKKQQKQEINLAEPFIKGPLDEPGWVSAARYERWLRRAEAVTAATVKQCYICEAVTGNWRELPETHLPYCPHVSCHSRECLEKLHNR